MVQRRAYRPRTKNHRRHTAALAGKIGCLEGDPAPSPERSKIVANYGKLRGCEQAASVKFHPTQIETGTDNPHPDAPSFHLPDPWEAAYLRFETPEQEIQKFVSRLRKLGAPRWPRNSEIVELFCGRGNGLCALERLGFARIEGVDLSPRLLAQYRGPAKCVVSDCRRLPFADRSKDVLIVQGGLHHLASLPKDLEQTFKEMQRVLRPEGRVVFVEPWLTPFLRLVHAVSASPMARRVSGRMDALATMIQFERRTYEQWLTQPELITQIARMHFVPLHESCAWGKWNFVGKPR
jgi:ubiquinone/menaquinone biosynthesis C-methylase UbiE